MRGKHWVVLVVLWGGLLSAGPSWGQESSNYNSKIAVLMQHYLKIQKSLANDSLEGVAKNGQRLVKQAQEIRILVADRMPTGAKRKLQHIKRSAGGLGDTEILVVRRNFKLLSQFLVEFLEMVGVPNSLKSTPLYVFYCPIANGCWLQADIKLANPFYGELMLRSGYLEGKLQSKVTAAYNGL